MDPKKSLKVHKAAEKFWLGIVIASALLTVFFMLRDGVEENLKMVVLPAIAFLWFLFRRSFRKRLEKQVEQEEGSK